MVLHTEFAYRHLEALIGVELYKVLQTDGQTVGVCIIKSVFSHVNNSTKIMFTLVWCLYEKFQKKILRKPKIYQNKTTTFKLSFYFFFEIFQVLHNIIKRQSFLFDFDFYKTSYISNYDFLEGDESFARQRFCLTLFGRSCI